MLGALLTAVVAASAHTQAFSVTVPDGYVQRGDKTEGASTVKDGGVFLDAGDAERGPVRAAIVIAPKASQAVDLSSAAACAELSRALAGSASAKRKLWRLVETPLGAGCQVDLRKRHSRRRQLWLPLNKAQSLTVSCFVLRKEQRGEFDACAAAVQSLVRRQP